MLSEARRRQITRSNDTAYVGSRPPFSARAGKSVHESLTAPMSARACFAVLARSLTASESPSRSDYPRIMANNNSAGLGGILPLQRAAQAARGQEVWSNHAEHGGMACHDDIQCAVGDNSSHGGRWRPVEAVLRSMRKQEIACGASSKPDVQEAS